MRFVLSLEALIRSGSIEEVEADAESAVVRLEEAQRHVSSASLIARSDRNGAFQLAYDAARKAVTAHMASAGFRVRATTGAHAAVETANALIAAALSKGL